MNYSYLFILLFIFSSCVPTPSVENKDNDSELSTEVEGGGTRPSSKSNIPTGLSFSAAKEVLDSRCLNCHGGVIPAIDWGITPESSELEWIDKLPKLGILTPGDPENSKIITRMVHFTGGNMPVGMDTVSFPFGEYDKIYQWVLNISNDGGGAISTGCGNVVEGGFDYRVRYESSLVPLGFSCKNEVQFRMCSKGLLTSFSGTYIHDSCVVEGTVPTRKDCGSTKDGEGESRVMYESSSVPYGMNCKAEVQNRKCSDGNFTLFDGDYSFSSCVVLAENVLSDFDNAKDVISSKCLTCHGSNGSGGTNWGIDNGDTEENWIESLSSGGRLTPGDINNSSIIQRMIHSEGSRATMPLGFTSSTFPKSDFDMVTKWVSGLDLIKNCGETQNGAYDSRVMYESSSVAFGLSCKNEIQSRLCSNGVFSSFDGSFGFSSCSVLPQAALSNFEKAKSVISNDCLSCHGSSWGMSPLQSESEWIGQLETNGLIVAGNASASKLTLRMIHSGGVKPDMPLGRTIANFLSSNYDDVANWVNGLESANTLAVDCKDQVIPARPLKRLSKQEYIDTLNFLRNNAGWRSNDMPLGTHFNKIPDDKITDFKGGDLSVSPLHAESLYDTAYYIATSLNDSRQVKPTYYQKVFQMILIDFGFGSGTINWSVPLDDVQRDHVIKSMGKLTYRRPLNSDEISHYQELMDAQPDTKSKVDALFISLFTSPQFLFHIEDQGEIITDANGDRLVKLTNYEIINRLSFTFWGHMPNKALFELADTLDLHKNSDFDQALNEVFSVANIGKVKKKYQTFIGDYLGINNIATFMSSTALNDFKGSIVLDTTLTTAMKNEIFDLMDNHTWDNPDKFSDTLTSKKYFAKDINLASIYGDSTRIWDGNSSMNFSDSQKRSGLLTRAGMLLTGSYATSPIHTGVFILNKIICDDLPDPPVLDPADLIVNEVGPATTRDHIENLTIVNKDNCAACHSKINPYGYSFEMYDSIGREREGAGIEKIYDINGVNTDNLQTSWDSTVEIDGAFKFVATPIDLSAEIAKSPNTNACFSKNIYSYLSRELADKNNSRQMCEVDTINEAHEAGGMSAAYKAITKLKSFKYKKLD